MSACVRYYWWALWKYFHMSNAVKVVPSARSHISQREKKFTNSFLLTSPLWFGATLEVPNTPIVSSGNVFGPFDPKTTQSWNINFIIWTFFSFRYVQRNNTVTTLTQTVEKRASNSVNFIALHSKLWHCNNNCIVYGYFSLIIPNHYPVVFYLGGIG